MDGVTRAEIHRRQIDFRGYLRSDGLFEVEGRLTDTKTHDFLLPTGGRTVAAGDALHDLVVTLVYDRDLIVRDVKTNFISPPYPMCANGGGTLQALIGLHIGAGWNTEIRRRLPSCETCTHMRELLTPMATAAFQTASEHRRKQSVPVDNTGKPRKIDSCYAFSASRELVEALWPEFHTPPDVTAQGQGEDGVR